MQTQPLFDDVVARFRRTFGCAPAAAACAPGRIEVLGNHTDYNEGFVLSAAIDTGICFVAGPADSTVCRVVDHKFDEEALFDVRGLDPSKQRPWANYIKGVLAGLQQRGSTPRGFNAVVAGTIPVGAGLSSSAALEISTGLCLAQLYGLHVDPLDMARIGQTAEHTFAGVRCGLLDQISSLFGRAHRLVMSDFRSLEVETLPLAHDAAFLMCNTRAKHALVDGEYNERRARCEQAAAWFAARLPHPVKALRDVSWEEWQQHETGMDPVTARRAAHVVGENTRVLDGRRLLEAGQLEAFGRLMFESHDSSRMNFENSCRELDVLVDAARTIPGVLGARLSGGGFGGSAVVLVHSRDAAAAGHAIAAAYEQALGHPCDVRAILPADGARRLSLG